MTDTEHSGILENNNAQFKLPKYFFIPNCLCTIVMEPVGDFVT